MKSYRSLGVSFYNGLMQVAEIEHAKKPQITSLGEFPSTVNVEREGASLSPAHPHLSTLAGEIKTAIKQTNAEPVLISFALPVSSVFVNILPIDSSLNKSDLQNFLQWEVAQYFPDAGPREFIVDSHKLPQQQHMLQDAFVAGVHRGTATFVQKVAGELNLKMHIVDIDQFASEKTLITNYPEILQHDIVLFGLRGDRLDASVIHEGQMTDYRAYLDNDPKKAIRSYLKYLNERYNSSPAGLLLHGVGVTQDLVLALREETGIKQTVSLNALRKIAATDKVAKNFGKDNAKFCAAIGLALRTQ